MPDTVKTATGIMESSWAKMSVAFAAGNLMTKGIEMVIAKLGELGKYISDAAKYAARIETLGTAMNAVGNNAGYTSNQMAGFESSVKKMGITTEASRDALTRMAGANMDLSKASGLARVAQDAAVIGGINSSEAFSRMIQGIRSGETEIMRNLGIQVNFEAAYRKSAQALGKTSNELTEHEKVVARTNAALEYGVMIQGAYEASMTTTGKKLTSMTRWYDELKLAFGEAFAPALGVLVDAVTDRLKALLGWATENKAALAEFAKNLADIVALAAHPLKGLGSFISAPWKNNAYDESATANSNADDAYDKEETKRRKQVMETNRIMTADAYKAKSALDDKAAAERAKAIKAEYQEISDRYQLIAQGMKNSDKAVLAAKIAGYQEASDVYQLDLQDQKNAIKKLADIEAARLVREQAKTDAMREQYRINKETAQTQYHTEDMNIGMMNDPAAQQQASLEARYQRERTLIEEKLALSKRGSDLEKAQMEQLAALQIELNHNMTASKKSATDEAWQGVFNSSKKAIPQLAVFDKLIAASQKDYIVKGKDGVIDQTKSNLSMYSSYAGATGSLFEGLAATQDKTSRSGFESAKAFNMASAVMSTAAAVMNALATVQPYPMALAAAALAAATGVIQIATIASTSFGGSGSVSAPSGSLASGGGGGGNSLANVQTPLTKLEDQHVQKSSDLLTAAVNRNSVVIGKLSTSIDALSAMFQTGGSGMGLAINAPGRLNNSEYSAYGSAKNYAMGGALVGMGAGAHIGAVAGLIGGPILAAVIGTAGAVIGTTVGYLGQKMFGLGNKWQTTGSGMNLSMSSDQVGAVDYTTREKKGGWFTSDKSSTDYRQNVEAGNVMSALMTPLITDLGQMADTLGTSLNLAGFTSDAVQIATAGRKPEDIAKDLEAYVKGNLEKMALLIPGIEKLGGAYDNMYERIIAVNNAFITANEQLQLIGDNPLDFGTAKTGWLDLAVAMDNAITSLYGGLEGYTKAMDAYREAMYTQPQRDAQDAQAAQRQLNTKWVKIQEDFGYAIPATMSAFNALRNSIDPASPLYAALTGLGPVFATTQNAAAEATKVTNDWYVREQQAAGQDTTFFELRLKQEEEMQTARESGLDIQRLQTLQDKEWATAVTSATGKVATATRTLADLGQAVLTQVAKQRAVMETKRGIESGPLSMLSPEAAYLKAKSDFEGANGNYDTINAASTAFLEASKNYSASGPAYQTDRQNVLNVLQTMGSAGVGGDTTQTTLDAINAIERAINGGGTDSLLYGIDALSKVMKDYNDATKLAYKNSTSETYTKALNTYNTTATGLLSAYRSGTGSPTATQTGLTSAFRPVSSAYTAAVDAGNTGLTASTASAISNTDIDARMKAKASLIVEAIARDGLAYNSMYDLAPMTDSKVIGGDNPLDVGDETVWLHIREGLLKWSTLMDAKGLPLPAFATGTPSVPYDMTANIHQGEIIMDRASSDVLRKYGIPAQGQADNRDMIAELRALREEVRELRNEQKAGHVAIAKNTGESAKQLRRWDGDGIPAERTAA